MKRTVMGIGLGLLLMSSAEAGDWPEWRGAGRTGKSAETGLQQSWAEGGPKLVWKIENIGGGYSTPAVVGDRLYFATNEGMENEYLRALSAKDGSVIWSTRIGKVGVPDQRPSYPGSRSMPTIDGDLIYVVGSDGDLLCLEKETGKVKWQLNFTKEFGSEPPRWAWSESPLIDGDTLICSPGGSKASILAVEKMTGKVIWKSVLPGGDTAGYGSPVKATISGVDQYVVYMAKGVCGVDASNGKVLWQYAGTTQNSPANVLTPVIDGDYVYTGSRRGGGGLVHIKLDRDPVVKEVYREQKLPMHIGGAVLIDGYLYGTTRAGLLCVDYATGEIKWSDRSVGAATVGLADGKLYVVGDKGDIALVEPTEEAYKEISRFRPVGREAGVDSWTYPVIANGRMYIRHLGTMWAFDVSADSGDPNTQL